MYLQKIIKEKKVSRCKKENEKVYFVHSPSILYFFTNYKKYKYRILIYIMIEGI